MFISLSSTSIQNFNKWHAPFVFLSHSVAVAAWSGIQRVDPQMIYFELFSHPVHRSQFNPQTIFVSLGSWKTNILDIHPKKDDHSDPFPQQGFCTSLQIWNELGVTWQTKQILCFFFVCLFFVFFPSQGLILHIRFSWSFLDLAC